MFSLGSLDECGSGPAAEIVDRATIGRQVRHTCIIDVKRATIISWGQSIEADMCFRLARRIVSLKSLCSVDP